MCQRYGKLPSDVFGFEDQAVALGFNLACDTIHDYYDAENEGRKRKAQLIDMHTANLLAFNGKPLELENDSFHSAGTSRKPRKSDEIERDADGRITDRQRAMWEAEGWQVV